MKEMERSEHSGAVVKTKSSSGCLIVEKKAIGGFSDSSSRKLFNLNKEKKRSRVVLSDSESSDELAEPNRRKVYKSGAGLTENKDFETETRVNNGLDVLKLNESDEVDELRIPNKQNEDKIESVTNENDEDFDESIELQEKNGVLKVNKDKSVGVSHRGNDHSTMKVLRRDRSRTINARTKNVTTVKGKESKTKRPSCTEKQLLREKIKKMLFGAGWTIDYRPRRNRDYLDSVYISPSGTGYWSITKAYEALQKEEKDNLKASKDFTPLPNEILNKLTRQTRKKIERDIEMNRRHEGSTKKSKRARVKKTKLSESRLKEASEDSDNSSKKTPNKDGISKTSVRTNSHIVQGRKSRKIGRLTLLVRGSDNGLNNSENDEFAPYSGNRTVLSWLIDSGMVIVGEKVEYMNLRKTRVMQEGWITKDGIHCGCCSKIITNLRFELHAGSKLGQPFQNIFIKSGQSLMQCQIDAWNKQKELEKIGFYGVDIDSGDPNDDTCGLCGDGGDLICCDGCPSTFHLSCLDMQMLPKGDWHCPNCACKYCERYCTKPSGRTKRSLLTCRLCEKKYHKSCSPERDHEPIDSNELNFPFCGKKCRELYNNLQKVLWIKHELDSGFSWSLIHRSDPLPDVSSTNYSQRVECNSKLAVALLVMDECFLPIVDRRSGITLIHNVVYNCGSNFSRLNYSGFFTAILERGDEMICAASIRIHGTQLAEMPFIGTRHMYRRQGMCRRLLYAIESALSSLKVDKLVIPAIEEHMHTWTNAFGFSPLEESQKQGMRSINMLVFPGTDMLQKPLIMKGTKGVEVDDYNNPLTKQLELNDATMQNGDSSTGNPSEPEIQLSRKKFDAQSNSNVLKDSVLDGNETTEGNIGADSDPKAEDLDLQNGNVAAIGITDSHSLQPHDTVSTEVSVEPQLQVTAMDSVSVDAHSDSIAVVQNGNVTIQLEPDIQFPGKESGSVDAQAKETV